MRYLEDPHRYDPPPEHALLPETRERLLEYVRARYRDFDLKDKLDADRKLEETKGEGDGKRNN